MIQFSAVIPQDPSHHAQTTLSWLNLLQPSSHVGASQPVKDDSLAGGIYHSMPGLDLLQPSWAHPAMTQDLGTTVKVSAVTSYLVKTYQLAHLLLVLGIVASLDCTIRAPPLLYGHCNGVQNETLHCRFPLWPGVTNSSIHACFNFALFKEIRPLGQIKPKLGWICAMLLLCTLWVALFSRGLYIVITFFIVIHHWVLLPWYLLLQMS